MRTQIVVQLDNITPTGPKNGKFFILGIHSLACGSSCTRWWREEARGYFGAQRPCRPSARCLEVPEWMLERAACCGLTQTDSPRVDHAALRRLKPLILEASGTPTGVMVEARPRSLPLEG